MDPEILRRQVRNVVALPRNDDRKLGLLQAALETVNAYFERKEITSAVRDELLALLTPERN